MTKPTVDDALVAIRRGQAAASEFRMVAEAAHDLSIAVDSRIFAKLLKGEGLSPEVAVQAWIEKLAYRRVMKQLDRTEREGRRAAADAGHEFDLGTQGSV